jgi:hypothetical protein
VRRTCKGCSYFFGEYFHPYNQMKMGFCDKFRNQQMSDLLKYCKYYRPGISEVMVAYYRLNTFAAM